MFNRNATSDYVAHGRRSFKLAPVPVLRRLHGEQRKRVEKSSKKVEKVLGATPIIDIIPGSPRPADAALKSAGTKRGMGIRRGRKAPPAPILRYKLSKDVAATVDVQDNMGDVEMEVRVEDVDAVVEELPPPVPRKAAPASLNLPTPIWRARGMLTAQNPQRSTIFLSPVSPLSPFSPIETAAMRSERYHGLRRLARTSRAFRETIVEELPPHLLTSQPIEAVNTYLDLYRISTKRESRHSDVLSLSSAFTATSLVDMPYTACSVRSQRRRSSSMSSLQRRSGLSLTSTTPTPRMSFIVPHSASSSVYSTSTPISATTPRPASASAISTQPDPRRATRYTLMINVPSPRTPTAQVQPQAVYSATSTRSARMSYTIVLTVPQKKRASHQPGTPADEASPLQHQQREARARTAILALALSQPPPASACPEVPALDVRSPRVRLPAHSPYWVRSSSGFRVSVHPAGASVRRTHSHARRSAARAPPTPRTMRRERRQGWGGEWRQGGMGRAVEGLKEIKTPVPRVPEKDVVLVLQGEAR